MNAVPMIESARAAIARLFANELGKGYRIAGCHRYNDADGNELFRAVRLKHETEAKVIRPMYRDGLRYRIGRPERPATGWPLYVPPCPLVEAGPVFVVEGEACADALAKLGMIATTSGGASSADGADWEPLRGRSVRVWPDNDAPGLAYAEAVATRLRALGCIVELVDVRALELPDKGDCADWLAKNPNATAADVLGLALVPNAARAVDASPEPLRRPAPPPEPYPLAELGPILQPAAESLKRIIQAPDAVCAASLLAAASLAVQGQADVVMDGRRYPATLWFLTIANSGERKSAVDKEAMRAARGFEVERAKERELLVEDHVNHMAEWEARVADAKSKAKKRGGMGLADALRAIGPAPPAPLLATVTVADFTAEGVAKLLMQSLPSVGAFSDEAALVFGGHGMSKEAVMRTAATLSKLWDSGEIDRVRASEGAMKLRGRRLAMHLLAQPVIAEKALGDPILAGQGFLPRCLLAWPESTMGFRPYCEESARTDAALERLTLRLGELHRKPLPLAAGTRQELDPPALHLDRDARQAWITLHNAVESQMRPGGRYAPIPAWASKAPEQALRIAGVLTLLEHDNPQTIDAATIGRASELALWHLDEALRLRGIAETSPEILAAEEMLNWCRAKGRAYLHSSDALRNGPVRDRAAFMQAVAELESAGWAVHVGEMELDGKRRRNVWRIVEG